MGMIETKVVSVGFACRRALGLRQSRDLAVVDSHSPPRQQSGGKGLVRDQPRAMLGGVGWVWTRDHPTIMREFRDSVWSKTDIAIRNEMLAKVLCHNIVVVIHEAHELGINPGFAVGVAEGEEVQVLKFSGA